MDKSFNDQELSDIMKEIEALEEDLTGPTETKNVEVMETIEASSPVLEELSKLDEEETVHEEAPQHSEVVSLETKRQTMTEEKPYTSMSFKVQGNLTLELQFDIGGKVVCVEVTEAGLAIEMEGGMKFTVPVPDYKKAV